MGNTKSFIFAFAATHSSLIYNFGLIFSSTLPIFLESYTYNLLQITLNKTYRQFKVEFKLRLNGPDPASLELIFVCWMNFC